MTWTCVGKSLDSDPGRRYEDSLRLSVLCWVLIPGLIWSRNRLEAFPKLCTTLDIIQYVMLAS